MEIGVIYFDKYRILDVLGRGGTSEVYLAENIKLGNKWAIKKALKANHTINLLAEPNILKNLEHFAVPKIIDIEEDEEAVYIIEEYVTGTNLKAYKIKNETIKESLLLDWFVQLCDVLKYLHQRKPYPIIYRDVKPENIMLMDDGKIKLIDFGIAREYKEERDNDTVPIGTRGYAAPEQYGIGQSDERTDIFSLGMTFYFLLTGKNLSHPPYKIQLTQQLNMQVTNELIEVVLKCCEILPDSRYQSIEAVEMDLKNLTHSITAPREQFYESRAKSKGKSNKDFKKTVSIGVVGVSKGVGTTHTSLLIASYLSKKLRVALIELNTSRHFREIGLSIEAIKEHEKKHFSYQNVDYYWDIPYNNFLTNYRDKYDVLIVDFGCYHEMSEVEEFVRADKRVVIGHGVDWKLSEIDVFYQATQKYDPNNSWQYMIPFIDKKGLKDVKSIVGNRAVALPFNTNPFVVQTESKRVLEDIFI